MTEVGVGAIPSTFTTFTFILSNLYLQILWNFQKFSQHLPGAFGAKKPPVPAAAEARAARAKLTSQLDMAISKSRLVSVPMRWRAWDKVLIRGTWVCQYDLWKSLVHIIIWMVRVEVTDELIFSDRTCLKTRHLIFSIMIRPSIDANFANLWLLHVWPHNTGICIHEQNAKSSHRISVAPKAKMQSNRVTELSYIQIGLAYAGNINIIKK